TNEFAEEVQRRAGAWANVTSKTWVRKVLGVVTLKCTKEGWPYLASLVVRPSDGKPGPWYFDVLAETGPGTAPDEVHHAAERRPPPPAAHRRAGRRPRRPAPPLRANRRPRRGAARSAPPASWRCRSAGCVRTARRRAGRPAAPGIQSPGRFTGPVTRSSPFTH